METLTRAILFSLSILPLTFTLLPTRVVEIQAQAKTQNFALIASETQPKPIPQILAENAPQNELGGKNAASGRELADDFVKNFIIARSKKLGVNWRKAVWIVEHESNFENRDGDDGNSRGFWQISKIYHPEISDKCAADLVCSTDWSLNQILRGKINEWSTHKFCRRWYRNCPF